MKPIDSRCVLGVPPEEVGAGNQLARDLGEKIIEFTPAYISVYHRDAMSPAKDPRVDAIILGETARQQMESNEGCAHVGDTAVAIGLLGGNPLLGDMVRAQTDNILREQRNH